MAIKHKKKSYEDIIHLPRHVSSKRTAMPIGDRAAQFAPFSAVVGYDAAVKELGRYTETKRELDEMEKEIINRQLNEWEGQALMAYKITYFQADACKDGGLYVTHTAKIKKIDKLEGVIYMEDGVQIAIDDVLKIDH